MDPRRVLVVDDEKNIRRTLSQTIEAMGLEVATAADGAAALQALEQHPAWLLLLDLKMPGLGGLEVLRRAREKRPDLRVVIITAHGSVDNAVEAMKLGAIDFLQKPFSTREIRALIKKLQEREALDAEDASGYEAYLERARHAISRQQFEAAAQHVRAALQRNAEDPAAHNLLGVLAEIRGDRRAAQQHYRQALALDADYEAARANLRRSVNTAADEPFMLDEAKRPDPHG